MGFSEHLIHRCTITPFTEAQGGQGGPVKTAGIPVTDVPCRLVSARTLHQRRPLIGESLAVESQPVLLLGADAVVNQRDEVSDVRLAADGSLVDAGPYRFEQVRPRNRKTLHHISLELIKVE